MWIWFAEINRTLGHSWLHWRRVLKFYEDYTLVGDIHPDGKYKYNPIMFRGILRDGEALVTCSARTSVIRQFALLLVSLGIEAYIPYDFYKAEKKVVHILSDAEINAFFEAVDSYAPAVNIIGFYRLATEYKVLFRLIYCCGLRISEARNWNN